MATYEVFELQPSDPTLTAQVECVNASGTAGGVTFGIPGLTWSGTTWPTPTNPQTIASPGSIIYDLNDNGDGVGTLDVFSKTAQHAFLRHEPSVGQTSLPWKRR